MVVRNILPECLGMIKPAKLVPALKEPTTNRAAFTRATVVVTVKQSIVARPEKIDEFLYPEISSFLMLIKDHDRHIVRAPVMGFLSIAARNKPVLIKGLLLELFLLLYLTIIKHIVRAPVLGFLSIAARNKPVLSKGLLLEPFFLLYDQTIIKISGTV